jgi:hypothetical protein
VDHVLAARVILILTVAPFRVQALKRARTVTETYPPGHVEPSYRPSVPGCLTGTEEGASRGLNTEQKAPIAAQGVSGLDSKSRERM